MSPRPTTPPASPLGCFRKRPDSLPFRRRFVAFGLMTTRRRQSTMEERRLPLVPLLTLLTFGVSSLVPVPVAAAQPPAVVPLQIFHIPRLCVTTQALPKVKAAVGPAPDLAIGKVYFRAAQAPPDYYYVVLKGLPNELEGCCPGRSPRRRRSTTT